MPDAAHDAEGYWCPTRFFRAGLGKEPIEAHGYQWRGLVLCHSGWAEPRTETRWVLCHLGSGGVIIGFIGNVATVMPVATAIAECGDWTLFDLPDGWQQSDPDLMDKTLAICAAHPEARPTVCGGPIVSADDARAVIAAREAADG